MAQKRLEYKKRTILTKLREAGSSGLTKRKLGVKDPKSLGGSALKALEEERQVANLGTSKKTRYVLLEFYNPVELACEQVETNAKEAKPTRHDTIELLSRKKLEKGCKGETRKKVDEAIDLLVKEHKLLRLKRGRMLYYLHVDIGRGLLSEQIRKNEETKQDNRPAGEHKPEALERERVLAAYKLVKERFGYSNVRIFDLQQELGVQPDELKAFLSKESQIGNAVLSLGDWSVSSEEVRSGAIMLFGKPHLLVRFDV